MAYLINEDCVSCGVCEPECPNGAISEGENIYVIKPDLCTECIGAFEESQCANVCPVDACVPDPQQVESRDDLLKKYEAIHAK